MMWVQAVLFSLLTWYLSPPAEAKVYRCEGAGGTTVLTNQPNGKKGCAAVTTQSASPPGGYAPPVDPIPATPLDLPPAAMPSSASSMATHQPVFTQPPSVPAASNDSAAPAAPEAQRCSPRVNPLNPFAGLNCPPAVDETKKP